MRPTKSRGECCDSSTEPQSPSPDAEHVAPLVPSALPRDARPDDARAIDSVATAASIAAPGSLAAALDSTATPARAGPPDFPRLLTPDEAADLLRTTRKAIYARAARGRLPGAVRDGRRLLVRLDQLLQSLESVTGSSPGSAPR